MYVLVTARSGGSLQEYRIQKKNVVAARVLNGYSYSSNIRTECITSRLLDESCSTMELPLAIICQSFGACT